MTKKTTELVTIAPDSGEPVLIPWRSESKVKEYVKEDVNAIISGQEIEKLIKRNFQ